MKPFFFISGALGECEHSLAGADTARHSSLENISDEKEDPDRRDHPGLNERDPDTSQASEIPLAITVHGQRNDEQKNTPGGKSQHRDNQCVMSVII